MRVQPKVEGDEDIQVGALEVLRAGVRSTPELRVGIGISIAMALVMALGKMVIPIAIQQILSKGISEGEPDWGFILGTGAAAVVAMLALAVLNRFTYMRLMRTAENVIYGLRTRAFAHVHRLSMAHHNESKRGRARRPGHLRHRDAGPVRLVGRGQLDREPDDHLRVADRDRDLQLAAGARDADRDLADRAGAQARAETAAARLRRPAHQSLRHAVGDQRDGHRRPASSGPTATCPPPVAASTNAIDRQYRSQLRARFFFAIMFPVSDVFGGLTLAAVVGVGVWWGPEWGLVRGDADRRGVPREPDRAADRRDRRGPRPDADGAGGLAQDPERCSTSRSTSSSRTRASRCRPARSMSR